MRHEETDLHVIGISPHTTASSRKLKRDDGVVTQRAYRGPCRVFKSGIYRNICVLNAQVPLYCTIRFAIHLLISFLKSTFGLMI